MTWIITSLSDYYFLFYMDIDSTLASATFKKVLISYSIMIKIIQRDL